MNPFDVFMIIIASIVLFIVIFSAIGSLSARNQQYEAEQQRQRELQREQVVNRNRQNRRLRQPQLPVIEVHRYPRYYDREVRLNFDIVENEEIEDGACCICLTELKEIQEQDKVLSTDCGHKYHKSCLEGWLKSKNYYSLNCPLCLQQLV